MLWAGSWDGGWPGGRGWSDHPPADDEGKWGGPGPPTTTILRFWIVLSNPWGTSDSRSVSLCLPTLSFHVMFWGGFNDTFFSSFACVPAVVQPPNPERIFFWHPEDPENPEDPEE